MGGKVLEHESKTIFNEGRAEGREEGLVEGKKEAALGMAGIGLKVEDIATALKVSVDIVKQWIGTGSSEHTAG
jgi:predicted transposase YdaD